jgi:pimeloyl-ACP methyl ester carboxylesterase
MRSLLVAVVLAAPPVHADARIARTTCPVPVAAGRAIDCFTLTVPENRAKPAGKTIGIPVVRFRSHAAHPGEPLVLLIGGPGPSTIRDRLDGGSNPYLDDRDFILFEQRGTRFSTPELPCAGYDDAVRLIEHDNLSGQAAITKLRTAATECAKQLAGIDLDGYDTDEIAQDLVDLQRTLAIPKLDLFAISYGTRVALEAMRRSPGSFHAVVLDSVLPPDVRYDELATDNALAALDRVLDACALDPACARSYPDLHARWQAALARANRAPIAATVPTTPPAPIKLTARNLMDAVYDALYSRSEIPRIPKLVDAIARGDLGPALKILADNAGSPRQMRGQRITVWCRDEAAITDLSRATHHPELAGWQTIAVPPEVCKVWPVTPRNASWTPVTSDVPTLVLGGEFDPVTPPAWGRRVRASLATSWFVEIPGETHGSGDGACATALARAFFRDPHRLPDTSCLARAPVMSFQ